MIDDIVTRLRKQIPIPLEVADTGAPAYLIAEAADEIERLREWKELAYQLRNKYWWAMRRKTLKKFDAMHKADWSLPKNVALREALKKEVRGEQER